MTRAWRWPNFTPDELRCPCGCGLVIVSDAFMDELQRLRNLVNAPMVVNSGCRCRAHNEAIGGHPRSLHICDVPQHEGQQGCLAVDIRAPHGPHRGRVYSLAWQMGWSIGEGDGFLHIDRRVDVGLPQKTFGY